MQIFVFILKINILNTGILKKTVRLKNKIKRKYEMCVTYKKHSFKIRI